MNSSRTCVCDTTQFGIMWVVVIKIKVLAILGWFVDNICLNPFSNFNISTTRHGIVFSFVLTLASLCSLIYLNHIYMFLCIKSKCSNRSTSLSFWNYLSSFFKQKSIIVGPNMFSCSFSNKIYSFCLNGYSYKYVKVQSHYSVWHQRMPAYDHTLVYADIR